jgi:hypothetical protein
VTLFAVTLLGLFAPFLARLWNRSRRDRAQPPAIDIRPHQS